MRRTVGLEYGLVNLRFVEHKPFHFLPCHLVRHWFGLDFSVKEKDAETVEISFKVNEDAMFYWAMQYGPRIEVLSPAGLRDKLAKATAEVAKKYAV